MLITTGVLLQCKFALKFGTQRQDGIPAGADAPETLEATVQRYNGFVDAGMDDDFAKPSPRYKIAKPPFYAAWATPVIHDTRAGLRINGNAKSWTCRVRSSRHLYSCGEAAGGFSQHGLARATCQGFIAGTNAGRETPL